MGERLQFKEKLIVVVWFRFIFRLLGKKEILAPSTDIFQMEKYIQRVMECWYLGDYFSRLKRDVLWHIVDRKKRNIHLGELFYIQIFNISFSQESTSILQRRDKYHLKILFFYFQNPKHIIKSNRNIQFLKIYLTLL